MKLNYNRPFSQNAIIKRSYEEYEDESERHVMMSINDPQLLSEAEDKSETLFRMRMDPSYGWNTNHFRVRKVIKECVNQLLRITARDRVVFITFTFEHLNADKRKWYRHANQCFARLSKTLKTQFTSWFRVLDVHRDGRPHFHVIAVTKETILEGFVPEKYDEYFSGSLSELDTEPPSTLREMRERRDVVSTNENLRRIWTILDKALPQAGFGGLYGVFPIRHYPSDAHEGRLQTFPVASYLIRSYCRAVPYVGRSGVKSRVFQRSREYPIKIKASDIKSKSWTEFMERMRWLFEIQSDNDMQLFFGKQWGLNIIHFLDFLNQRYPDGPGRVHWKEFQSRAWLASQMLYAINHDSFFNFIYPEGREKLLEVAQAYVQSPIDPVPIYIEPLSPISCTCCGERNPANRGFTHAH